ncbi:PPi-type phosphoenolpyruvate carboxykinase [Gammaproteobacteria bacterium]
METLTINGTSGQQADQERERMQLYISFKLASSGQPVSLSGSNGDFLAAAHDLLCSYREKGRLLTGHLCAPDRRIQDFLEYYLAEITPVPHLPDNTLILDRPGMARELSLPMAGERFACEFLSSYRVRNGVLHNPTSDRRTTQGSFHIVEGGLPIPGDKKAVPKVTFARLLQAALDPPPDILRLPFTAGQADEARIFVSLLLRPVICPAIPGIEPEKNMEIRFFAPGNLVSNLDFVESIFGNGGNPSLADHDAGLDVDHWSGHTGCVILAPHLPRLTKQALGLPAFDQATERQRREGMCWREENELYNEGAAFKITARDERGVIITLIADNYYGYCKKEVKTQISYAVNLYGLAEEEHAGGALAFPRRNHGEEYGADGKIRHQNYRFDDTALRFSDIMDLHPEGYGVDKTHPEVIYVPHNVRMDLAAQRISWVKDGQSQSIKMRPDRIYVQPNGYKIEMQKHPDSPSWRLIGTEPEGTFCHKPCTVSGGGKSEISKSLDDAVIYGPLFVADLEQDLDQVEAIFNHDYTQRFRPGFEHEDRDPSRALLSPERSLGSMIKLLTPSPSYTEIHNAWLESIPNRILAQAFVIKRMYHPDWGNAWRSKLSVDFVNGQPGHELKLGPRKLVGSYLRVGFEENGAWRVFKLRQDFIAAEKVQMEDDITASVVVPTETLSRCAPKSTTPSAKLVHNCETRLFQRPDDAILRGYDRQTEADMARRDNFMANYEPLAAAPLADIVEDVVSFGKYTAPMRRLLQAAYEEGSGYVVSSAHPRLVNGKPSKNPRYLQLRHDLVNPVRRYVAEIGARFQRCLPMNRPLCEPVDAVLVGRRNNPPEPGIRPLAVYNPIHYQELPELFMDFICSLTGKSPSTTGAGSEGALTKGPFNALRPTSDLNNALVSYILTGYAGFSTAAGHIGPNLRVDHDISLLVPEIWSRLSAQERSPEWLIAAGYLEKMEDFTHNGRLIEASRLGWRITKRFVHGFLGKIFDAPMAVFTSEMLRPESQDLHVFADGVENIVEAQRRVAQRYLDDGSIEEACPPLKALLHIMAKGRYQGRDVHHPEIRALFTRESLIASAWYQERLEVKQARDIHLWQRHIAYLEAFLARRSHQDVAEQLAITDRLQHARATLERLSGDAYLQSLRGTIGADPMRPARSEARLATVSSPSIHYPTTRPVREARLAASRITRGARLT